MIKPYYSEAGIQIYLGDCRDILPSLPKVDLVLNNMLQSEHEQNSTGNGQEGSRHSEMGTPEISNRMALHSAELVTGKDSAEIWRDSNSHEKDNGSSGNSVSGQRAQGEIERKVQGRNPVNLLSPIDPKGQMREMFSDGEISNSSQKRKSSGQPPRKSPSALRKLSQQPDNAAMVGISQIVCITDPPYGVGMDFGSRTDDTLAKSTQLLKDFLSLATSHCKITLTTDGCYAMELELYKSFPPKWRICWRKGITSRPSAIGFNDWEPIFVYGNKVHRNAHDLITAVPEQMGTFGHPTPKPIKLLTWLIHWFSDANETILDPFMGSGTTLRAAKDLGRKAIGIEIEEKYCEIAVKRLRQEVLPL